MGGERRDFYCGTVRPGLAEAGVQARVRHPFVHGRDGAGVDRLVNWLFSHQTAEKVLFGLIAVTVFIAIATDVDPYVGVAAVATAVVVFFWGRHRQGGVVVGGKHGDDKGAREPDAPPPVAPPDELPEFAKKADDLDAIKKAVDDAASVSGGLWLSYLFVLFYLAVAAGAVTHTDLFFEKAVKLPFLGIDLPLVPFFFMAPILFVIVHTYTLVHLVMLTDKAKYYHQALDVQIEKTGGGTEWRKATRDKLRRQLPSNILIQFLAGPSDVRESAFGWLLRTIAWITLVIAPVLLLLTIQIQFLPYHSWFVAWTQRIALLVDIAFVWWLWRKVLSGGESADSDEAGERDATAPRTSLIGVRIGLFFSLLAIAFSWAIATFPGEWQEELLGDWEAVTGHNMLFSAAPNKDTHRRFPFSNTLVLSSLNVYEGLGIDDPEKAKWREFVFHLGGRDLRGAIFNAAILPRVDFTGAHLQGVRLTGAQLQGASLNSAELQGATLDSAQLQGTLLENAQLQGASLDRAQLQGASLNSAALQGANLRGAELQGASLTNADLLGANLSGARLQGAGLNQAELDGALFTGAQLQGVSFSGATLKATDLSGAYLWRSNQTGVPVVFPAVNPAGIPAVIPTDIPGFDPAGHPALIPTDKPAVLSAISMVPGGKWQPLWQDSQQQDRAWDDNAYKQLRTSLKSLLPPGTLRDAALKRIEVLDCSSPNKKLESCDPASAPPTEATAWRTAIATNIADVRPYRTALATSLRALFCPGDENEALVVRNVAKFGSQLQQAGPDASGLIAELLNKNSSDCPVAASLTDADRATLLSIKQQIESAKEPGLANPR